MDELFIIIILLFLSNVLNHLINLKPKKRMFGMPLENVIYSTYANTN